MNQKILVIRFGSLGDVILASAPILNLKIGFPESHITLLTKSKHAEIAKLIPGVDEIIPISNSPGFIEYIRLVAGLEQKGFGILVDLQGNARSYLARQMITASQKVVYARDRAVRNRIVRLKDFPNKIIHTIDKYNEALAPLGRKAVAARPILNPDKSSPHNLSQKQIVIAPGASFSNKQWPIERFAETAAYLHQHYKVHIIWAITTIDNDKLNIKEKLGEQNVTVLLNHPLHKLAGVIAQSELCLANDSGIAHLSSAVGTPVVAVFGPTHPALGFSPRGLFDQIIENDEYCRPCSLHGDKPCFRSERFCFTRITASNVIDIAKQILKERSRASQALFVDRDGTVIVDKPFDSNPDNIEFEKGSIEALKLAQSHGFKIIIVSNQSGIARGYFKIENAEKFNAELQRQLKQNGIKISAVYFCPHYASGIVPAYSFSCNCRKPAPGMVEKAAREHNLDLRKSYVVGDKTDDFNLGRVTGMKSFLVRTGQGENYIERITKISENPAYDICNNLLDAVSKIIEQSKES